VADGIDPTAAIQTAAEIRRSLRDENRALGADEAAAAAGGGGSGVGGFNPLVDAAACLNGEPGGQLPLPPLGAAAGFWPPGGGADGIGALGVDAVQFAGGLPLPLNGGIPGLPMLGGGDEGQQQQQLVPLPLLPGRSLPQLNGWGAHAAAPAGDHQQQQHQQQQQQGGGPGGSPAAALQPPVAAAAVPPPGVPPAEGASGRRATAARVLRVRIKGLPVRRQAE